MTEVFKAAIERNLPVRAHVSLMNGEQRIRIGPVAKVTAEYVTIHDSVKGFRTTPLALVRSVKLIEPRRTLLDRFLDALIGGE